MKQFLIKYRHTNGTAEDWHKEIATFIANIDGDQRGFIHMACRSDCTNAAI